MSQENVEAIKNAFAAWNDCDMESFRELFDPEVISRPPEDWPEQAPVVGREAVMRNYDQLRDAWELDTVETISDFVRRR